MMYIIPIAIFRIKLRCIIELSSVYVLLKTEFLVYVFK